jgi:cytochrome c553
VEQCLDTVCTSWAHGTVPYPETFMKVVVNTLYAVAMLLLASGSSAQNAPPPGDVAMCAICHGAHGEGSPAGVPRLAGQNPQYLGHALSLFKAGTRASPIMQSIAKGLSDETINALAQYYSGQRGAPVEAQSAFSPELVHAGEQVVESGPAPCFSCHGAGGKGNGARYPGIAGQPERFLVDRLHEFQRRAREGSSPPGTMTAVSTLLSEDQIESSAAYLSRLQR